MKTIYRDQDKKGCRQMYNNYIISVIIPIYNTERYLEEAIQSITSQSLGFEKNIQLILINDCSPDNSKLICEKYKNMYPQNIIYKCLSQNSGVSAARNVGIELAKGKYIAFLDSDDRWSDNALKRAVDFFDNNYDTIDLVSADIEFFDLISGKHILNQGLKKDTIIDIDRQYNCIRTAGGASIIKTEAAKQYKFNENQKNWEDAVFINQIILNKQKYGMLSTDVKYFYRKRLEENSATQSAAKTKDYFLGDLNALFQGVYSESLKKSGYFVPMMQYLMAYALGYRFQETITVLNETETKYYSTLLYEILQHIDDKYLLEVCNADYYVCKSMLAYKAGIDIKQDMQYLKQLESENKLLRQRVDRSALNYKLLTKMVTINNKNIAEYLKESGFRNIAIYGMSDIGSLLLNTLKQSNIKVLYTIDKRAAQILSDVPVITIEQELPQVDAIIVTAAYFYTQIKEQLKTIVKCPIISIEEVLDSIE